MIRRWDKSKPPTGPFALNRDAPQAQGLVAWYPMGGPSGRGLAQDLAGQARARTLSGTVGGITLGDMGQPAQTLVSASSQFVGGTDIPVSAFPLSISAWFRPATAHSGTVAGLNNGDLSRKLLFCYSGSTIRAFTSNGAGSASAFPASTGSYTTGKWTHGAAVFASSTSTSVYRDGNNKTTDTTAVDFGSPVSIRIGHDGNSVPGSNYFNGDVGEVGFWAVALGDDLVWRLYDPGTRYELWYPLRSRKWMVSAGGGSTGAVSLIHGLTRPNLTSGRLVA